MAAIRRAGPAAVLHPVFARAAFPAGHQRVLPLVGFVGLAIERDKVLVLQDRSK